jgi:hypothetical protein
MPNSLPTTTYSPELIDRTELAPATGGIWLIAIWAIAMLLFSALANVGGTGEMDAFQLLAPF